MAHLPPVDNANRIILLKSIQHIADYDAIIKKYKEEDQSMAQTVADLRRQLDELESKRKVTNKALKSAEASKQIMESTAEKLRCISPPINYLPEDILIQIFHLLVLEGIQRHRLQCIPFPFDNIPFTIGQVCSHWRSIVHQNSRLWDHVPTIMPNSCSTVKTVMHTTTWLSRGSPSAQSIFINGGVPDSFLQYYASTFGSGVIYNLIHIEATSNYFFLQNLWDINAICAKEVSLSRPTDEISLIFYMPLMQYATILTLSGKLPVSNLSRWKSLKSLTLGPFTAPDVALEPLNLPSSDFLYLLRAAPHLIKLEVDFITTGDPRLDRYEHNVRHVSLSSMSLYLSHFETAIGPFGVRLDAPLLQHLNVISFHRHNSSSPDLQMAEWHQPTKLSLNNLREQDVSTSFALFYKLPSLDTLQLEGDHIDALLAGICSSSNTTSETATLPLQKLSKIVLKGTDVQGRILIELLEARLELIRRGAKDIAAITNVMLYDNDGITVDDWKRAKELLEIGTGDRV